MHEIMKTFIVWIFREGQVNKYKEEWHIQADGFFIDKNGAIIFFKNGETSCDLQELVGMFVADKYSIMPQ
jgi:hypothetical protein